LTVRAPFFGLSSTITTRHWLAVER
jgi:hypothetical protein